MNERIRGLYKRGRIHWLTFRSSGKKQFCSLETSDYVEAVNRAAVILRDPSLTAASTLQADMTRFIDYQIAHGFFTPATARTRRAILPKFGAAMNWISVTNIRPDDIQTFYNDQITTISPGTAYTYIMMLRSFFRWCVEQRLIRSNPAKEVKMARARSPARQKFCTFEQRDRLLHNAPDDLAFILHCGFFAGLRKNEIIQARPDWFDLKAGVLHVLKTETFCPKSKKERTIPLCKEFREFLAHYGLRSPFMLRPEVKQSELGRYRSEFTSQFARYVSSVDASLSWVTPHVMRHTFGSLLAIRNCSIYKIAKWLGDELGTTQKHYAHLLPVDDDIELSAGSSPSSSRATPSEIDFSV